MQVNFDPGQDFSGVKARLRRSADRVTLHPELE